jgi:hypothetical protein
MLYIIGYASNKAEIWIHRSGQSKAHISGENALKLNCTAGCRLREDNAAELSIGARETELWQHSSEQGAAE